MSTEDLAKLAAYDSWSLLEETEIARIAWEGGDGISLVPVNYTVGGGALWFRVDPGSALARECGDRPVVIEVDGIDPERKAGWSVVVVGIARLVDELDVPDNLVEMRVWPSGPHRLFVRVEPDRITGRRLRGA